MINKNHLLKLIEPHFAKDLAQDNYEIETIKANKLLTSTRFDLAFKLLYLDMKDKGVNFATEFYKEHIRAFSLGKFSEPGNESKDSIERFYEEFDNTYESIKESGFDSTKTLIPLSKNGSIANGSHRVASAIHLDLDIECVKIDSVDHIYDYRFFYNRNVSSEILDAVATKFVEYADDIFIAFIWPRASGKDEELEKIIPNIVYQKDISLTPNGAHNLLSQIYFGEEWLGSIEDGFAGSKGKLAECFPSFDPVRVVAFQAGSLDEALKIKEAIRELFDVGKHSVHITDTKEEAIRVTRVVFSGNGVHFLNHAKPNRYPSTHKKLDRFKEFVEQNSLSVDSVVLDGGIVLSFYGLRECSDIDYLLCGSDHVESASKEIEHHDEELKYHGSEKCELIYNPRHHFYFNDLKFVSFMQLYKMKKSRGEIKDLNDCKMMEALLKNNRLKQTINKLKQDLFYLKIKTKVAIKDILKSLGLFEVVKKMVKSFSWVR